MAYLGLYVFKGWKSVPSQGRYHSCRARSRPVWQGDTPLCAVPADGFTSTSVDDREQRWHISSSMCVFNLLLNHCLFFLSQCYRWNYKRFYHRMDKNFRDNSEHPHMNYLKKAVKFAAKKVLYLISWTFWWLKLVIVTHCISCTFYPPKNNMYVC